MSADPSLVRFRAVVAGALAHLESRRQEINDLNVFPVADGDTGDNMALTLEAVLSEVDRLSQTDRALDEIGRDEIVDCVARAALLGARGNSGVILSQLIRGAAEELISQPGELVDPVLISAALAQASKRAYASVRAPAEGTILTVMREMSETVAIELAKLPAEDQRLTELDQDRQNGLIAGILEKAIEAGEASVRRGPDLLPALREAGVVDAGGYAVTIIFAGVVAVLRGTAPPEIERHLAPARVTHPEHESATYRYCTNFAVTRDDLEPTGWIGALEELGDSVLVVGDARTLKVHVHTDEPALAQGLFNGTGAISHVEIADMHEQVTEREARLNGAAGTVAIQTCMVLAVVAGSGLKRLYTDEHARIIDGGRSLNPSTEELLAGIHEVPAEEVVVLPNSPNVIMAAERAAELSEKTVIVVPTRSQQAGLMALLPFAPDRSALLNAEAMVSELEHVRTGGVAPAGRDDAQGRFRTGDAVGYVDDELMAWGDPQETLRAVLAQLGDGAELVTLIAADETPLDAAAVAALVPDGVELEPQVGGQPAWWWLLSAE